MKFRIRGNSAQVLRIEKDNEGKSNRTNLGSINLTNYKVTEKLNDSLNNIEQQEVHDWIANRQKMDLMKKELAAKTLVDNISEAQLWLIETDKIEAKKIAEEILESLKNFRSVIKKHNLI